MLSDFQHILKNPSSEDLTAFKKSLDLKGFICAKETTTAQRKDATQSGWLYYFNDLLFGAPIQDCSYLHISPMFLFRPFNSAQLQSIVKSCAQYKIPLTVAGGKTGLSGAYANPYCIVDMEYFHSLPDPYQFNFQAGTLVVDQQVLVAELISQTKKESHGTYIFPTQPSSAFKLPVTIGGILSTNASGVVSSKLGPISDWIISITIMLPTSEIHTIVPNDDLFNKIIGGLGYYGIILNTHIRLAPTPKNLSQSILYGDNLSGVFEGLQEIQEKQIFPLVNEFVLSEQGLPQKFGALFDDKSVKWAILIKDNQETIEEYFLLLNSYCSAEQKSCTPSEFQQFLEERTSIALLSLPGSDSQEYLRFPGFEDILVQPKDFLKMLTQINQILHFHDFPSVIIGYGHLNFRKGRGILLHLRLPVLLSSYLNNVKLARQKIAEIIFEINIYLLNHDIRPKAEHGSGVFSVFESIETIIKWVDDIKHQNAFRNPHLLKFNEICIQEFGKWISLSTPDQFNKCFLRYLNYYLNCGT